MSDDQLKYQNYLIDADTYASIFTIYDLVWLFLAKTKITTNWCNMSIFFY